MLARRLLLILLFASLLLHLTSCSLERRLANNFVTKREPVAFLLLPPDFSYKYSYKIPDIENFESLPQATQDSLLFYNSDLLQYINDSTLINGYINGLNSGLKALGYSVYLPGSTENFVNSASESIIVNLAQLQLEEFYDSISDDASFGDEELYSYELYITALNVNSWIELSRVNHNDTATQTLYASSTLTDYFDGGFRYFPLSGDVKYTYSIDSLRVEDVYYSVNNLGYLYAGYLFDYLMNDYIQKNLPPGRLATQLYTFDRYAGMVRKQKGSGFTLLN